MANSSVPVLINVRAPCGLAIQSLARLVGGITQDELDIPGAAFTVAQENTDGAPHRGDTKVVFGCCTIAGAVQPIEERGYFKQLVSIFEEILIESLRQVHLAATS